MSNGIKHLFRHRVKRHKPDTARLAARLAPLEEQGQQTTTASEERAASANQEPGTIVVDKNNMQVPREMMEGGEKTFLGMEPVALVILVFMLCFIAFIAWQISQMPVE
ncbi:MAG TPA: hypothetical protein VJU84_10485 [Pyrinomonadaceae bacterium]|nr:hypothetical protein [Pyrinomonadaceae bacterium]